ncbi:MAG TPA: OmpA family protein [Chitinophagaceae bacterium]|nr:OmpA family protein [Chitinophagaceae bacterium]
MKIRNIRLFPFVFLFGLSVDAQTNLLLNGAFEDVNTCTEYNAECGVEAWFYLKDVKAQMLNNDINQSLLGNNSFGIFYNWKGYTDFMPIIGAILPCGLQKGHDYTFTGIIKARLNSKLILKPGICMGEKFYVPLRPFSKSMKPEVISQITAVPGTDFFHFEYHFTAAGDERYLTFGSYIQQDSTGAIKKFIGVQTVSLVLDNFELIPDNKEEILCNGYDISRKNIYNYNFRHKEMDYSLFGKGELAISIPHEDSDHITRQKEFLPPSHSDTIKLGDVFFDFDKSDLKQDALALLQNQFSDLQNNPVDSIYIEGHTDSIGTDDHNLTLSKERCQSVSTWLVENKIVNESKIYIHPFGESKPIASNNTPEGRSLNRRVELILFRSKVPE